MSLQNFEVSSEVISPVINSYAYEDEVKALSDILIVPAENTLTLDRGQIPPKLGQNLVNFLRNKINPAYENGFAFLTNNRLAEWSGKLNGRNTPSQQIFSKEEILIGGHTHDGYEAGIDIIGETQLAQEFRSKRLVYYGPIEPNCQLSENYKGRNEKFVENVTKVWLKWCPGIPSGSSNENIDARLDMSISANKSLVVGFDYITLYFFNKIYAVYDINSGDKVGDDIWYLPEVLTEKQRLNFSAPQDNITAWYALVSGVGTDYIDFKCFNWWGESISCPLSLSPQQGSNIKENDIEEAGNSMVANIKLDNKGRVTLESYWEV